MGWKFSDELPIYQQIMNGIKQRIAAGEWVPGQKLPAVRELAVDAGVNPNTMQKALAELEREGLLCTKRTAGRFVAEQEDITNKLQEELVGQQVEKFLASMKTLGYSVGDIITLLQKILENEKGE